MVICDLSPDPRKVATMQREIGRMVAPAIVYTFAMEDESRQLVTDTYPEFVVRVDAAGALSSPVKYAETLRAVDAEHRADVDRALANIWRSWNARCWS